MKQLTGTFVLSGNSFTCPAIRYLTGFSAPDDVVVILAPGKCALIVNDMEFGRAANQSSNCDVFSYSELLNSESHVSPARCVKAWLEREGFPPIVHAGQNFPFGIAHELTESGVMVIPGECEELSRARMVKSADEISKIAAVQHVAGLSMKRVGEIIEGAEVSSDGTLLFNGEVLTSEQLRREVRRVCMDNDCIDEGTIVAGGAQAANPHECGHGPIRTGEWVVADIFPRSLDSGYWGDMTRSFINGSPSPNRLRLYNTVAEAQKIALGMIAPGVTGRDVHIAVSDFFESCGYKTYRADDGSMRGYFHSTGHGVGLEIHEEPRLSLSGGALEEGMTVTVEPGLYYPDIGGVRIEDLVVVTSDGCKIL